MTSGLTGKRKEITERLDSLDDAASQCDYLMVKGMSRTPVPEIRKDAFRIAGCKTAIWARTALSEDTVIFEADSDSLLVRGVLALYDELYNGTPVKEAYECAPLFLEHISEEVIYKDVKNNGLKKCYEMIQSLKDK